MLPLTKLAAFLTAFVATTGLAQKTTREIYEQNKGAVVLLLAYDSRGMPSSLGSGFYFETNRIASNFHVVDGASRIAFRVIGSKDMHEVKRVASISKSLDLAILEVEQEQHPLIIAPIDKIGVGDKVVAIGNPRGLEGSVSEGIVSAIRGSGDVKTLQITAPISPGSSGGPLFSPSGEVIGITTATLRDSQSLNFAVPAALISTLRNKGKEWEPLVGKDTLAPETGNAGVQLVAPKVDNYGQVQISLLNVNKRAIQNVTFLLVFTDQKSGKVVHFITDSWMGALPPGLAKRYTLTERSLGGLMVDVDLKVLTYDFARDSLESDVLDALQK